jgi:hypothetical protein
VAAAGEEGLARDEGHVFLESALQQPTCVHPLRELDPQEEPAGGPGEADVLREVFLQGRGWRCEDLCPA